MLDSDDDDDGVGVGSGDDSFEDENYKDEPEDSNIKEYVRELSFSKDEVIVIEDGNEFIVIDDSDGSDDEGNNRHRRKKLKLSPEKKGEDNDNNDHHMVKFDANGNVELNLSLLKSYDFKPGYKYYERNRFDSNRGEYFLYKKNAKKIFFFFNYLFIHLFTYTRRIDKFLAQIGSGDAPCLALDITRIYFDIKLSYLRQKFPSFDQCYLFCSSIYLLICSSIHLSIYYYSFFL